MMKATCRDYEWMNPDLLTPTFVGAPHLFHILLNNQKFAVNGPEDSFNVQLQMGRNTRRRIIVAHTYSARYKSKLSVATFGS